MILAYLDQIWDAFKEGICITDIDGTILLLNYRYSELSGINREEMLGQTVGSLVQQGLLDVVLNPEVIETGKSVTCVQKVSTGCTLILEGYPVFDVNGKAVLCITFIRDITSLSDMRRKIASQKELLDAFQQLSTVGNTQKALDMPKIAFSSTMQQLYSEVDMLAETDVSILLLGETGVGKDVLARRIHAISPRATHPYIKVDCGSIASSLIETELFGYDAGTFSGASKNGKVGLLEAANKGTLFLDEIGELPMPMQTRLLRFLQDWEIVRVGSTVPKQVNVRILAATNKNLEKAVAQGEFRSDLYYRLKVAVINIPPLRERETDIIPLAKIFLELYDRKYHKKHILSPEAARLVQEHDWPGNVRELENLMQSLVVTCKQQLIQAIDLPFARTSKHVFVPAGDLGIPLAGRTYKEIMKEVEDKVLCAAMKQYGSITEVAKEFKLDRSTVFRKIKNLEKQGFL